LAARRSRAKSQSVSQVADHLHSAAIHLLRRLRQTDTLLAVSGPKLSALSVLVFGGPCTLGALANAEHLRGPTMSQMVEELERAGLLVRRQKPEDRRSVLLEATPRGREVLEQGRQLRIVQLAEQLEHLTSKELETLRSAVALLERLLLEHR